MHDARVFISTETDECVEKLQKRLSEIELELQATQEDLNKSKLSLSAKSIELEAVSLQLQKTCAEKSTESIVISSSHLGTDTELHKELEATRADLQGLRAALLASKDSIESIVANHRGELEGIEKAHVDELADLRRRYEKESLDLVDAKEVAYSRVRELEVEKNIAMEKAQMHVVSHPIEIQDGVSVTREELARMHEAHNLKVHTMEAEHRQVLQVMSSSREQLIRDNDELRSAAERREMEMHFLTTENEENADRIKRYVISHNSFVFLLGVVVFRRLF